MKILIINDYGTPTGGSERMSLMLRDGLRQRGHDARLFASSALPNSAASLADYECLGTVSRFRTLLQTANPWAAQRLRQVLNEFRPDIVHVKIFLTQLSPLILPLLQSIPSIYNVSWYRPICPIGTKLLPNGNFCHNPVGAACYQARCLPLRDWLPLMLQMQLWHRWRSAFNLVIANSHAVKDCLVQAGIAPVDVVWNGIPIRPPRPPLTSPPTVAFAGRLVEEKGVDVLLRAFAQVVKAIPEARLLVAGEGPDRDRLIALIAQLKLHPHVTFLGHLSRSELEHQFSHAWVQAVPSRWAEPFGIVAPEAMMRGTAVIASLAGGLSEIVCEGQTGFLVPPGEVEPLAQRLIQVLSDRSFAEQLGHQGRAVALSQFSESVFIDRFIDRYQFLLQNGTNASTR